MYLLFNTRKNDKILTEGEQEKTHFAIKITNEEVFVVLQHKSGGMTIKHIVSYLKHFYKNYNNEYNNKNNITYNQLASDNFEEILKNMNDIKLAEITIDKKNTEYFIS